MVARNEEKMKTKIQEIKAAHSGIECDYIICDFSKFTTLSEYRELYSSKIGGLDIAVAVANAGYALAGKFEDNEDDLLVTTMNINVLHVYYTMKVLSEQMLKRDKRSAMIIVSSQAAVRPFPMAVAYCAQKSFATFLAQGMALEMGNRIDIMSFNPGSVATKLIQKDKSQAGGIIVTVEKAVRTCLRDLGHGDFTFGTLNHELAGWMVKMQPLSLLKAASNATSKEALDT